MGMTNLDSDSDIYFLYCRHASGALDCAWNGHHACWPCHQCCCCVSMLLPCCSHALAGLEVNPDRPHEKLPYRGEWLWVGSVSGVSNNTSLYFRIDLTARVVSCIRVSRGRNMGRTMSQALSPPKLGIPKRGSVLHSWNICIPSSEF